MVLTVSLKGGTEVGRDGEVRRDGEGRRDGELCLSLEAWCHLSQGL